VRRNFNLSGIPNRTGKSGHSPLLIKGTSSGDSGPCRSVFRDMPIAGSGVIAIMIPG